MRLGKTLKKRGAVLIVVLGVLVILALLATTFATLQQLDRTVSRNYVDDVRAKLVAQSGVEYAISEIRGMMTNGFFNASSSSTAWVYYGSQTDETQPPNPATAIELAKNPSWASELDNNPAAGSPAPKQLSIRRPDGSIVNVGFTATHETGRYAQNGDIYTLRVVDASGMVYVNDGLYQYGGNNSSVSQNLKRILNNLGKHTSIAIPTLGDQIMAKRGTGFISKYDIRDKVGFSDATFNKFKDYLTTQAWVDKNVVNPVPYSNFVASEYPVNYWRGGNGPNATYRRGRGPDKDMDLGWANGQDLTWYGKPTTSNPNYNGFYGHDELFPQYVEVVWRAPVNINTAAEPVLMALLMDVSGVFSIERRRFQPYTQSPPSFTYSGNGYGWSWITFTVPQAYYTWHYVTHTFSTAGTGGDEIGYLHRTTPIYGPGATVTGGVSAQTIANHIIACRSKSSYGPINYAGLGFAGPFKTWAQFHFFLDYLVEKGVLWDGRTNYGDYQPGNSNPNTLWPQTFVQANGSSPNNRFASYALADALKANFNPNCILNETNPDRNMVLKVDKTDLIVNSTEFCFTPMGYYEIESLGRVLRPEKGSANALSLGAGEANQVLAEKKILVTIKLYDAYRETSQRHFYGSGLQNQPKGSLLLSARQSSPETSNNRSVEVGPEPDNGPLVYQDVGWGMPGGGIATTPFQDGYAGYPAGVNQMTTGWGYEYSGYIALPTYGGDWYPNAFASYKPPSTLWKTDPTRATTKGGKQFGSTIHSHFAWDFDAHYHESANQFSTDSLRYDLASRINDIQMNVQTDTLLWSYGPKIERYKNWPDKGEVEYGPYSQAKSPKYRMARSFRLPAQTGSGSQTIQFGLNEFAPSDLRIDGGYSERHSGIAYWIDQNVSWNDKGGMIMAWVKPSFYPEFSGKMRKVFSMSRYHVKNYSYRNPNLWDMFYMPAHDSLPYQNSGTEGASANYVGSPYSTCSDAPPEAVGGAGVYPFRPMSFNTTWGTHCYDGSLADVNNEGPWLEQETYSCTPSLNHRLHGSNSWNTHNSLPNYLDKGKWTHVLMRWYEAQAGNGYWSIPTELHKIETYIDGSLLAGHTQPYAGSIFTSSGMVRTFTAHMWDDNNTGKRLTNAVRLGETSTLTLFSTFMRNYSADMTFDEFYAWKLGDGQWDNAALSTALAGSWQKGRYYTPGMGTSGSTDSLFTSPQINLDSVAPMRYLPPASNATPPYSTGSSGSTSTVTSPAGTGKRLLGVSWTWFAETYDETTGLPIMYDYVNPANPTKLYQTVGGSNSGTALPICRVKLLVDGQTFPLNDSQGYTDDGFSQIVGSDGKPYQPANAQNIKYQVKFTIKGLNSSTILLATPYFEDITLYFDQGDVEFLLYALVNTV